MHITHYTTFIPRQGNPGQPAPQRVGEMPTTDALSHAASLERRQRRDRRVQRLAADLLESERRKRGDRRNPLVFGPHATVSEDQRGKLVSTSV